MPRSKPDKIIEHRLSLGKYERDQIDALFTSINIKNVATPTVSLLSDVSGMIAVIGILELIFGVDIILNPSYEKMEDVVRDLKSWNDKRKLEGEQVALGGKRSGIGLIDSIIDFIELIGDAQREAVYGDTEGY